MTDGGGPLDTPTPSPPQRGNNGLPLWLTATVVLTLLALFGYNIVINGAEGLPNSYILASLLGLFGAAERFVASRNGGDQ